MIGSETFIIVALRCTENSTSSALARAICSVEELAQRGDAHTVASTTSPASTGTDSLSTVSVPSSPTSSMRSVSSAVERPTDFSLERKSSAVHVRDVGLRVRRPGAHRVRVACGRSFLTDAGARRSELPSRSTGLTALPLTLS